MLSARRNLRCNGVAHFLLLLTVGFHTYTQKTVSERDSGCWDKVSWWIIKSKWYISPDSFTNITCLHPIPLFLYLSLSGSHQSVILLSHDSSLYSIFRLFISDCMDLKCLTGIYFFLKNKAPACWTHMIRRHFQNSIWTLPMAIKIDAISV